MEIWMKIIGKDKLDDFVLKHTNAKTWIETWIQVVEAAEWKTPPDLKKRYPKASILPENMVFFDIKGDHYRMKAKIDYPLQIILVQWVGTHGEYTRRFKKGN